MGQKWDRSGSSGPKSGTSQVLITLSTLLEKDCWHPSLSAICRMNILRLFSIFSDYSQTILRPDKTRVDQPTVLVGWFSTSKFFQSIFGNPLTLWWKRNSSVGAHKTLSTRFCGYPCGMYRGTHKIAPECNFMDTHRLFHHHAEMHSVGVGCIPHMGVMGRGGRWGVDPGFLAFLKPYREDPFPTHHFW